MLPFALQAVSECPAPADLALALGAEFEPIAADDAHAALDELGCDLAAFRHVAPREQLVACAAAVGNRFTIVEERKRIGRESVFDDLLLHRVLRDGSGHALPLTIAAVEAGRRAGIALGAVGRRREQYLAHAGLAAPHVADLRRRGPLVDLTGREEKVGWQCAHQLSALLLDRIAERAERIGHLSWALRAAELRLALPVCAETRERMERELERVRTRLN
ncbi:hypothetical protein [Conexibacter woesei]|uniref:Uncharacterized protein n=1 Tax=Conexibacter woesei (strain DSM 14684 / CCUG 47730 / CIP 108061 / JCM 11494 / NBRC 100937 / ID131577) TaxID=469383 RepID=D3F503_CONWI|nr:hypothetical protein [Conexibacter woesei]ADB48581.1 hypothetical protein Cwoe_0145 [Conexibacter woesei DSM 14684]